MKKIYLLVFLFVFAWILNASEGVVIEKSILIDPKEANYEDCNFTIKVREANNEEIILVITMFEGRVLSPESAIPCGTKIVFDKIDWDSVPEKIKERQLLDDFADKLELPRFFGKIASKASSFEAKSFSLLISEELKKVNESIDLYHANDKDVIKDAEQIFARIQNELYLPGYAQNTPNGVILLNYSDKSAIPNYLKQANYSTSVLQSIIELNELLKKQNVSLIVIINPSPSDYNLMKIGERKITSPFLDIGRMNLIRDLLKHNILALDTLPALKSQIAADSFVYDLYDLHNSSLGNCLIAEYVTGLLGIQAKNPKVSFQSKYYSLTSKLLDFDMPRTIKTPVFSPLSNRKNPFVIGGDSFSSYNNIGRCFAAYVDCEDPEKITCSARFEEVQFQLSETLNRNPAFFKDTKYFVLTFYANYIYNNAKTKELSVFNSSTTSKKCAKITLDGATRSLPATLAANTSHVIQLPGEISQSSDLKVKIRISTKFCTYQIKSQDQVLFNFSRYASHGSGVDEFVINLSPGDIVDGHWSFKFDVGDTPLELTELSYMSKKEK